MRRNYGAKGGVGMIKIMPTHPNTINAEGFDR